MSARLDSSERIDPAKCHPDTRIAVIGEIMEWVVDSNPDASMMRVHGPAGAGKSALAQSIGELCRAKGWLAASFFFSRTAPGRNNGRTLFPTLAYQIATSHPEARYSLRKRIERDPSIFDQSIQTVMEELILGTFNSWFCIFLCWITGMSLFQWLFRWPQPRLVVIDGLDECDDPQIQCELLRVAANATKSLQRPFRIIITSRPESHIMHTIDQEPIFRSINSVVLDLGERNATHDIVTFLIHEFEEIKRSHPLARRGHFTDSWPGRDVIFEITRKASGQFVYPSVVMKYVQSIKHDPELRLNIILGIDRNPNDDNPFSQLDALYEHILSSVQDVDLMKQVLGIMAIPRADRDGLGDYTSPSMMEKLLSLHRGRLYLLLGDLKSLMDLGGPDEPIKFFHASFSDFLLDPTRSGKWFVDTRLAHERIAKGWLRLFKAQYVGHKISGMEERFSVLRLFVAHYKAVAPSECLQKDLETLDLFYFYKRHTTPILKKDPAGWQRVRAVWDLGVVQELFHVLVSISMCLRLFEFPYIRPPLLIRQS
jgi:hypothetical protein